MDIWSFLPTREGIVLATVILFIGTNVYLTWYSFNQVTLRDILFGSFQPQRWTAGWARWLYLHYHEPKGGKI